MAVISAHNLKFGAAIGRRSFAVVYRGMWKEEEVALKKMKFTRDISAASLPSIQENAVLRYNYI